MKSYKAQIKVVCLQTVYVQAENAEEAYNKIINGEEGDNSDSFIFSSELDDPDFIRETLKEIEE